MIRKQSPLKIPIYQVDAFTEEPFRGNPAGVCLLEEKLEDKILQSIASEMNLSETAFVYPLHGKSIKDASSFSLRWFTPKVEVPLCGHATLATAAVLFFDIGVETDSLTFQTMSGTLIAKRDKDGILLDFPADELISIDRPVELLKALGIEQFLSILHGRKTRMLLIHLADEEAVKNVEPKFESLRRVRSRENLIGIIVTASGNPPYDFVSRFFAPWVGIDEDPVTGSAHTVLTPYWSKLSGKKEMVAYQASSRGGKLIVRMNENNRVDLIGSAVIVLKGELSIEMKSVP